MSAKPQIKLYVDIVSPFGYLAFYALRNFAVFKDVEVTYVPVFLGGIMKLTNNRPPLVIKNKAEYIAAERLRIATQFHIPMTRTLPPKFPANTIHAQRLLTLLHAHHPPATYLACLTALYEAYWVHARDITSPETLHGAIAPILGADEARKQLARAGDDAGVKEELNRLTQGAVDEGAFGLPYLVATDAKGDTKTFWGFDSLGRVCGHLGLDMPREGAWRALL